MHSNKTQDYALLFLLALIWSTSFLLIKIALPTLGPFTLTAVRLLIAAALLMALMLLSGGKLPLHKNALQLYLVVGILGNTLPFCLISLGEVYIDSSLAAILMGIMPISTFVMAHFFIPSESMNRRKVFGVSLGIAGLVTLVGLSAFSSLGSHLGGQLVVLSGALCYSVTTIFVRKQPSFDGIQMATGATVVAAVTCLPLAFAFESPLEYNPDQTAIFATLSLGIFHTAIAALIYFRIIHRLGAVTFAHINYLIPILGSIWGVLLLSEIIGWNTWAALGLVLAGIYFIQPPRRPSSLPIP
ncbi:MAG: DMT family transporter [Acidiferrobacterales bacterium]|nr:DMT family transporter [Acidiferrobacterales bacterium]